MRMNCGLTLNAWSEDKPYGKGGEYIWTDGSTIYSYGTWIMAELDDGCGPRFRFNDTKYSQTTTTHQNAIREYMISKGKSLRFHEDVPRGTYSLSLQ